MVGVYHLTFSKTCVTKTLRHKHPVSRQLLVDLSNSFKLKRFRHIIKHACQKKYLGKHIVKGYNLPSPGNYWSPIIPGLTMSQLMDINRDVWHTIDPIGKKRLEIIEAIRVLQQAIKKSSQLINKTKKKFITGDWALHNLVFNENSQSIINVDLEGFYTYSPDGPSLSWKPKEHHVYTILKNLRYCIQYLQQTLLRNNQVKKDLFLIPDKA